MEKIKIIGFAGSLRKDSYNKAILRAAGELLPENTELEIFDLEGIPLYNQDIELEPFAMSFHENQSRINCKKSTKQGQMICKNSIVKKSHNKVDPLKNELKKHMKPTPMQLNKY